MQQRFVVAGLGVLVLIAAPRTAAAIACDSNLLIVLDRSCSMNNEPIPDAGAGTKWQIAVRVLRDLATTYQDKLRFGIIFFPDKAAPDCEQAALPTGELTDAGLAECLGMPVGPGQWQLLMARLADPSSRPNPPCVTNIDTAMEQAETDPSFQGAPAAAERRSFVLLITDGAQSGSIADGGAVTSCGGVARDPLTVAAIQRLYDKYIPTYVVGYGGAVRAASLDEFAAAGGVGKPLAPHYYQAGSGDELQQVLEKILGDISQDPELGGCLALPCPDGRCPDPATSCVAGQCVSQDDGGVDAGAADAPAGGDGGDGGDGGPGAANVGGCGCRTAPASAGSALLLLLAVALARPLSRRKGGRSRAST